MRVLIAGGRGFLGSALSQQLSISGHEVWTLTRGKPKSENEVQWDGIRPNNWAKRLEQVDAVVNLTGYGLEHWPWTTSRKRKFVNSRVQPGEALVSAIRSASHRPQAFVQISGINYYGAAGDGVADESSPAAEDFHAQLAVTWEAATQPVEDLGVRRAVARTAVVLASRGGLFPLMALPVRLYLGGPLGSGKQAVPWIHIEDEVRALQFLLEDAEASGPFNLVAPQATSNAAFMQAITRAARRSYWLRAPGWAMRMALGEMSTLVLEGRYSRPKRLEERGFAFRFPTIDDAMRSLFPARDAL